GLILLDNSICYAHRACLDTLKPHHYVARDLKRRPQNRGKAGCGSERMARPQDDQGRPDSAKEVTRDLASRIASAKRERAIEDNRASVKTSPEMSGMARGMRIGTEFIAAI